MNLSINDPLNLRDYIEYCVDFVKENCDSEVQPRTIRGYFLEVLQGLRRKPSEDEAMTTTLQKLFSGNVSYLNKAVSVLAEEILSGQHDEKLLRNLRSVCEAIRLSNKAEAFYAQLMQMVSLRFFDAPEREDLLEKTDAKEYEALHLALLKHGFGTMYNIPCFFADRIYEEALTYDYDSPLRYALMKTAAERGNKSAAREYGNYIAKNGSYSEAFNYLMMALPLPAAMWNLAFLVEKAWVGKEEEKQFRAAIRIDDKLAAEDLNFCRAELEGLIYTGKTPAAAASLLFCYKVYFYLAYHGFYKGFNSMAKLLSNSTVSLSADLPGSKTHSFALRDRYWKAAITGGNITAISNEGNRLFREKLVLEPAYEPNKPEVDYMRELMEVAAGMKLMHASYNLGNFYEYDAAHSEKPMKSRAQIREIYLKAAELDLDGTGMNGNLYYRLGFLSEERKEKKTLYKRAIKHGTPDAAYQLALLSYEQYREEGKAHMLLEAENYLREYLPDFSAGVAPLAKILYEEVSAEVLARAGKD